MKKSLLVRLIGAALALALVGVACGGGDAAGDGGTDTGAQEGTEGTEGTEDSSMDAEESATGVDTGAAKLRQTLTDLLDSHVYLAGIAVEQAVLTEDPNSPQFKAAAATLDQNSQDLASAIESIYGAEAADAFLEQWREHIGFFVDYTIGGITNNRKAQQKAAQDLAQYEDDFGVFLSEATGGELPADGAAEALQMHVDSLVAAVDSVLAGDPQVFEQLYAAAHEHMPMTAAALAGAIAVQMPEEFDGDPNSSASELQSGLTDLLNSHVFLAGIAVEQAVLTEDPNSSQFKAAAGALDQNSQDLAAAIESLYGPEAGDAFLEQWREHIGFFVDYTVGGITKDRKVQQKAVQDLAQYEDDFGAFLSEATGGELEAGAASEALQMHVDSLVAAVDSVIGGDAKAFDQLYAAAKEHMPMTASALAGAIVEQNPDQFAE
ncbi:MAG: copper amine oxidase [Actinomycetota bacterium]